MSSTGGPGDRVFDHPYLETCCRSALHRLLLCDDAGRPPGLKDGACLARLEQMGLAEKRADHRFEIAEAGRRQHDALVTPVRVARPKVA